MINIFKMEKLRPTTTRKLPLLPRFGFVVDVAGRRISFRQAPLLETMVNLVERGITLSNMQKIVSEQLGEIKFPFESKPITVNVQSRTIARRVK